MSERKIGSIFIDMLLGNAKFDKEVSNFQKKLKKFGKDTEALGKSMSTYLTAPLAAAGAFALKSSIDFESAFTGIRKTVKASDTELKNLEQTIVNMSLKIPKTVEELSAIGEIGGQLGVKTQGMEKFILTMAQLSDAAPTIEISEASTALAQFAVVTKMSQNDFDRLGSTVVALGNNLATNERDIINMGQALSGVGAVVGMSQADIMGLAGALSQMGLEADGGGSAIGRVLKDMAKQVELGGDKLKIFDILVRDTGKSFSELFKANSADALAAFIAGLEKVKASGGSVLQTLEGLEYTEERASKALLMASGNASAFAQALGLSRDAWAENTALQNEANTRYATTASLLKILYNTFRSFAILIGDELKPLFRELILNLTDVGNWFRKLDPSTRSAGVAFLAVVAAAGPLIVIFAKIIALFVSFNPVVAGVVVTLGVLTAAWIKWGDEFKIGLSIVGSAWDTFWSDFNTGLSMLPAEWQSFKDAVIIIVQTLISDIKNIFVNGFHNEVVVPLGQNIEKVKELFWGMWDSIVGHSSVPDTIEGITTEFKKLDDVMVKPAADGTKMVNDLFRAMSKETENKLSDFDKAIQKSNKQITELSSETTPLKKLTAVLKELFQSGRPDLGNILTKLRSEYGKTADSVQEFDKAVRYASKEVIKGEGVLQQLDTKILELNKQDRFPAMTQAIQDVFSQRNNLSAEEFTRKLQEVGDAFVSSREEAEAFARAIDNIDSNKFESKLFGTIQGISQSLGDILETTLANAITVGLNEGFNKENLRQLGAEAGSTLGSAYFGPIGGAIGGYLGDKVVKDTAEIGSSQDGTIKGVGTAIDTIFPGVGTALAGATSAALGGSKTDNELALEALDKWIEETIAKNNKQTGGYGLNLDNLDMGSFTSQFEGDWSQQFWSDFEGEGASAFIALGEGLADIAGIGADVGGQLGYILAQNLNGNIDSARLLLLELGIGAEQLEAAFMQMGKSGEQSWHAVEVYLQGIGQLTAEGLTGVGDIRGAYDQLIASAGRGERALLALRNMAIESGEIGGQSLDDLRRQMEASGQFSMEEIDRIFQAFAQRGITSVDDLRNASDRTLGGIVADLESLGISWGKSTEGVDDAITDLDRLDQKIADIPKEIDLQVNVKYNEQNKPPDAIDKEVNKVFPKSLNRQLEVNLPREMPDVSARSLSKLDTSQSKVSQDLHIHIDARNSAPGVEENIRRQVEAIVDRATAKTLRTIYESARR